MPPTPRTRSMRYFDATSAPGFGNDGSMCSRRSATAIDHEGSHEEVVHGLFVWRAHREEQPPRVKERREGVCDREGDRDLFELAVRRRLHRLDDLEQVLLAARREQERAGPERLPQREQRAHDGPSKTQELAVRALNADAHQIFADRHAPVLSLIHISEPTRLL